MGLLNNKSGGIPDETFKRTSAESRHIPDEAFKRTSAESRQITDKTFKRMSAEIRHHGSGQHRSHITSIYLSWRPRAGLCLDLFGVTFATLKAHEAREPFKSISFQLLAWSRSDLLWHQGQQAIPHFDWEQQLTKAAMLQQRTFPLFNISCSAWCKISVMPVGSGNLGVGPVLVRVEAKGGDWTDESNTLLAPDWGVL